MFQEETNELAVPSYEGLDEGAVAGDSAMPDYTAAGEDGGIIEFDVSDTKNPFEPAPHGNYRLSIKEYGLTTSKNSGNPMIAAVYEIVGPEGNEFVGKQVFDNMVMSGKGEQFGKWRHKQITEAVGLPTQGGVAAREYIGKQFDAELAVDPGNEQNPPKNTIKNVFI